MEPPVTPPRTQGLAHSLTSPKSPLVAAIGQLRANLRNSAEKVNSPFKPHHGTYVNGNSPSKFPMEFEVEDQDDFAQDDLHGLKQQLAELQAKVESNAKVMGDMQSELDKARQQRNDAEARLRDQINGRIMRLNIEDLEASKIACEAQITLLNSQLKDQQDDIRHLESERDSLLSRIAELESKFELKPPKHTSSQQEIAPANEDDEFDFEPIAKDGRPTSQSSAAQSAEIYELRQQLERAEIELNDCKQAASREQAQLKKKIDELQKQNKLLQKREVASGPSDSTLAMAATAAQLKSELEQSEDRCRALETELLQTQQLADDLQTKLSQLSSIESEFSSSSQELSAALQRAHEAEQKYEDTLSNLQALTTSFTSSKVQYESEKQKLNDRVEELEQEVRQLREQADQTNTEEELAKLDEQIQILQERLQHVSSERDQLKADLDAQDSTAGTGLPSRRELEATESRHQAELDSLTQECQKKITEIEQKEKKERVDLKEHFTQMRQYVDKLEAELNSLKQKPPTAMAKSNKRGCCSRVCGGLFSLVFRLFLLWVVLSIVVPLYYSNEDAIRGLFEVSVYG